MRKIVLCILQLNIKVYSYGKIHHIYMHLNPENRIYKRILTNLIYNYILHLRDLIKNVLRILDGHFVSQYCYSKIKTNIKFGHLADKMCVIANDNTLH